MLGEDVVNMGVNGYGTLNSIQMLTSYGLALRPKIAFYGFFENDFGDNYIFAKRLGLEQLEQLLNKKYIWKEKIANPKSWKSGRIRGFLHDNSVSYRLLKFVVTNSLTESMGCEFFPEEVVKATTYNTWVGWEFGMDGLFWAGKNPTAVCTEGSCSDPPYRKIYRFDGNDEVAVLGNSNYNKEEWISCSSIRTMENIQRTGGRIAGGILAEKAIIKAKKLSDEAGAEFITVIIPTKEEINGYRENPNKKFHDYPKEEIKKLCREEDLRCLDLTPIFKEHALKGEQLYFMYDDHFNENGHKVAAQAIYKYLDENNLLPGRAGK